jgi:lysine 2,3-aminomutase
MQETEHAITAGEPDTGRSIRFAGREIPWSSWTDWRWQLRNRLRDLDTLERCFTLTEDEREAVRRRGGSLPLGITPYYANCMDPHDPDDPLRKTMIPRTAEFDVQPWERLDPLGEEDHMAAPGLVHTYPHKVLFLVTDFCATYCRYCTRSRMVGSGEQPADRRRWEAALDYIRARPAIRDVLLSGGDPLVLSDERLAWLLDRLREISHVELIRIGTKIPAVLPQRITPALAGILGGVHPLWLSIHFTHPAELTAEVAEACDRLSRAGIPLTSQSVLLAGVNDDPRTLQDLFNGLLNMRVKPYYLHQCDAVAGSSHFKTTIRQGLDLMRGLHGYLTGYAIPHYMVDAPGGGGKVPLTSEFVVGRKGDDLVLRNYEGALYRYPDPPERAAPAAG